jgi:hypothetical protein
VLDLQGKRIHELSDKLDKLGQEMARAYPEIEPYQSALPGGDLDKPRGAQAPPEISWGLVSSVINVSSTIIAAVRSVKDNRKTALALVRRVQVVMDVMEPLKDPERMPRQMRRVEVEKLLACLGRCAEAVGAQTEKGLVMRVAGMHADDQKLRALSDELSDCLQRLGLDLGLHLRSLDVSAPVKVNLFLIVDCNCTPGRALGQCVYDDRTSRQKRTNGD